MGLLIGIFVCLAVNGIICESIKMTSIKKKKNLYDV